MKLQMTPELENIVKKHISTHSEWHEGEPVKVFRRDGLPCVQYESGAWWHYSLKSGTWF